MEQSKAKYIWLLLTKMKITDQDEMNKQIFYFYQFLFSLKVQKQSVFTTYIFT